MLAKICFIVTMFTFVKTYVFNLDNTDGNYLQLYKGFKRYEIVPTNRSQNDYLAELISISDYDRIEIMSLTKIPHRTVQAIVPLDQQTRFEDALELKNIKWKITESDMSQTIEIQQKKLNKRSLVKRIFPSNHRSITFLDFYRHSDINEYLDNLMAEYPDKVKVEEVGKSYEGRSIKTILITDNIDNQEHSKPTIFIDAGIHAREWIAPATALYVIEQLVKDKSNQYLLSKFDWIILPVVNPDGYEFTFTKDRFWRKTRSLSPNGCIGTDGNRNYDFHWGEAGAPSTPCSNVYRGPHPFSEKETQHVRDILLSLKKNGIFYLSLHAFGELLLYPWGWTSELPPTAQQIDDICQAGAKAILEATGKKYIVGSSTNVLYPAAGGSDDFAYGVANIPISVTMELAGDRFDPNPSTIEKIVNESWVGIKAMAKRIITKKLDENMKEIKEQLKKQNKSIRKKLKIFKLKN